MNTKKNAPAAISRAELKKYSPELPLTNDQLNLLLSATPERFKKTRKAKGGGTWTYVSGGYVTKVLNLCFGFNWSFQVQSHDLNLPARQALVLGRLTVRLDGPDGKPVKIVKEQFGRADVKFKRETDDPLDLGNDFKAAATDALKKCASLLGVAADIYAADDFREVHVEPEVKSQRDQAADRFFTLANRATSIEELEMLVQDAEQMGGFEFNASEKRRLSGMFQYFNDNT